MSNLSIPTLTMSSREIADLVNSRHDSVKRSMERLSESEVITITPTVEPPPERGGKPTEVYLVNKRDSYVVVAQLSPEFTAKLVDRWQELEESAAQPAKPLPKPRAARAIKPNTETAKIYLMFAKEMQKIGVSKELSLAAAMECTSTACDLPMEPMRKALPAPEKLCNLNQTELGAMRGVSSVAIGKLLREHGLMETGADGERMITDKGKPYGSMAPFVRNGHSGYEPRWSESVLNILFPQQVAA